MRGTLLNAGAVAAGASIGLLGGSRLPAGYEQVALHGLGLVVALIGVKMFLQTKNPVVVVAAVALGGLVGAALGIEPGLAWMAESVRHGLGGSGSFNDALITTTVLYCVGPMTLIGCLQDGIEGKFELLATKSMLDGISSIFFAATLGVGVLATALVLLVIQGSITLLARPLRSLASNDELVREAGAAGGAIMLGIGLNLLGIKPVHMELYVPGLLLAPVFAWSAQRWSAGRVRVAEGIS